MYNQESVLSIDGKLNLNKNANIDDDQELFDLQHSMKFLLRQLKAKL